MAYKKIMQARGWQLTMNHPEKKHLGHDEIKKVLLDIPSIEYFCMCDEIGAEGTYHTHTYFKTRNSLRFSTVKNKFPTAHIEKVQGTPKENREYIRKEGKWADSEKKETNLPDTFEEWGKLPKGHQGKRTDLSILLEMIENGLSTAEILRQNPDYLRYLNHIDRTRQALREEEFRNQWRKVECIYVFGETNTNKTRTYMEKYGYENVYRITNYNGNAVWDGYRGQDVVIFEEYRGQLSVEDILTWTEGYPNCSLRARYTDKVACFTKVIFISNIPLEDQHQVVQKYEPETWRAFLRRIQRVYHHESRGKIIEYKSVSNYLQRNKKFQSLPKATKTPFDKKSKQKNEQLRLPLN